MQNTIVKVMSKPGCVQCVMTVKKLKSLQIAHLVIDMTQDDSAIALVKRMGYLSAPVVIAGSDHWSGFQPDKIESLLESA